MHFYTVSNIQARIDRLHLIKRTIIRRMATSNVINKWTLQGTITKAHVKRHTIVVRPLLTDGKKLQRLKHALESVAFQLRRKQNVFNFMFHQDHVVEKKFGILKEKQTFYLTPTERRPHGTSKVKYQIGRIMFRSALERSPYDSCKKRYFDANICIWPIVEYKKAYINSSHRGAETV